MVEVQLSYSGQDIKGIVEIYLSMRRHEARYQISALPVRSREIGTKHEFGPMIMSLNRRYYPSM
jgi:hypothetical protein